MATKFNKVGKSKTTKIKYELCEKLFTNLLREWKNTSIGYVDLNTGPGYYYNTPGLAMRFLHQFIQSTEDGHENAFLQCVLCEINETYHERLICAVEEFIAKHFEKESVSCNILNDNMEVEVQDFEIPFPTTGVIVCDPNGIPDFNHLQRLRNQFPNLDTVIHLNHVSVCRHAWRNGKFETTAYLNMLNYTHWYASKTFGNKVIVFGSNNIYPNIISSDEFHHIDSTKGREIFKRLNSKNSIKEDTIMTSRIVRTFEM